MKRNLYPDEAFAFEVVHSDEAHVANGTVVEGLGESGGLHSNGRTATDDGCIAVRLVDPRQFTGGVKYGMACIVELGFVGCVLYPNSLRPLTPAAVEMLALVSAPATSTASRGPRKA